MATRRRRGMAGAIPPTPVIIQRIEVLKQKLEQAEILLRVAQELDAVERDDQSRKANEEQLCAS